MSTTGELTPHINMQKWIASDKPQMEDFNRHLDQMDGAYGELADSTQQALLEKASKTPPEEIAIPYLPAYAPYSSKNRFYKNAFGEGVINLAVKKADGSKITAGQQLVATLPVGYRPDIATCIPCGPIYGSSVGTPWAFISSDGSLYVGVLSNGQVDGICGAITYRAYN